MSFEMLSFESRRILVQKYCREFPYTVFKIGRKAQLCLVFATTLQSQQSVITLVAYT